MEKNVVTPKTKFKTLEKKSFSPQPIYPLKPICPNLFFRENAESNISMSPCCPKYRVKKKLEWKEEEDNNIREFVKKFGTKNWKKLSEIYPGKTPKQYREHYFNCLETNILKKKDFSIEEDEMIISFIQNNGRKFAQLSKLMPGRTETSIKNRFYFLSKNNFKHLVRSDVKNEPTLIAPNNISPNPKQKNLITDKVKDCFINENQDMLMTTEINDIFDDDDENFLIINQEKNNFIDENMSFINSNQNKEILVDDYQTDSNQNDDDISSVFSFSTNWITQPY